MKTLPHGAEWRQAQLAAFPLLRNCPVPLLQALAAESTALSYDEGETLLVERDPPRGAYVLLSGAMSVYYASPEGERVMVKLFAAPAFFGEMEALVGVGHLENVEVLRDSTAILLPTQALMRVLQGSNAVCYQLLVDVCARLCVAARNEYMLAFSEVEQRMASFLLGYAHVFGTPDGAGGVVLARPITQEQLAASVGATVRSVQRAFLAWKTQGLVMGRGRKLVLADLAALEQLAEGSQGRIDYRIGEMFGAPLKAT